MLKTSGTWARGKRYGYYRAIVLRKGIEHAVDKVQVQLLEADDKANSVRVVTCVDLDTPGLKGYVTDLDFEKIDDTRMAVGIDIGMKAMSNIVLREVFFVDATGGREAAGQSRIRRDRLKLRPQLAQRLAGFSLERTQTPAHDQERDRNGYGGRPGRGALAGQQTHANLNGDHQERRDDHGLQHGFEDGAGVCGHILQRTTELHLTKGD